MTTLVASVLILSNILVSKAHTEIATSSHNSACKYTETQVDECWKKFSNLPVCENREDPLVECAIAVKRKSEVLQCDSKIQKYLHIFSVIYKNMRDSLCSDQELYEEFKRKASCWQSVRKCSPIFAATTDVDRLQPEDCRLMFKEMEKCIEEEITCINILRSFRDAVTNISPCAQFVDNLKSNDTNGTHSTRKLIETEIAFINLFVIFFLLRVQDNC